MYTDLYVKPSDKQLYLDSSSNHPLTRRKALSMDFGYASGGIARKRVITYSRMGTESSIAEERLQWETD